MDDIVVKLDSIQRSIDNGYRLLWKIVIIGIPLSLAIGITAMAIAIYALSRTY